MIREQSENLKRFQDVEDADRLPPGQLQQQHADPGQEDLRLHRPAGLHQR